MTMLKEAKKALRVTVNNFDSEIAHLLMAGANDLEIAGVVLPGTVTFTIGTDDAVTDASTLTDDLVMRAIITYAQMRFGNPPNYDRLADAYDTQKVQLMHATGYTAYPEDPADDDDQDGDGE
jgi:hypothetical protein